MKSLRRTFSYLLPEMKKYPISGISLFAAYAIGVFFDGIAKPFIYKKIIDQYTSGADVSVVMPQLVHLIGMLCIVIIIHNIAYRIGDYTNSYFQSNVMKSLYDSAFSRILKHSYTFFSNTFSGSVVAKVKRFSKSFETFFDVVSYQIWFSGITLIGIFVVLFATSPVLGLLFFVWTIIYIGVTSLFLRKKIKLDIAESETDSKVTGSLADAILNVLNIKIFASSDREQKLFESVTSEEEYNRRRSWYFGNLQNLVQAGLMALLQIGVVVVSAYLWSHNLVTVGTIVLAQMYIFNLFDILWGLGRSLTKAVKALTDMKEVVDLFDQVVDVKDPTTPQILEKVKGEIMFSNVSFSYTNEISVFKNFDLVIKPGERVGLVGHSGAGKSTITKLVLRFADVTEGAILIDGVDIRSITQDTLRSIVSYVPQESVLFHRSIGENIAYGKPDASFDDIVEAAQKAHAHEFIDALPQKYNTLVGERGVKLSGGERQRVAIARAMLKNAPLLILDEATSSLDSVSESYIQEAFDVLMKEKTTIVIAHRLSTIQKMDRIIVLENGGIIEEGTHAQLLKKKGVYADLWAHQSGGFIE